MRVASPRVVLTKDVERPSEGHFRAPLAGLPQATEAAEKTSCCDPRGREEHELRRVKGETIHARLVPFFLTLE